MARPLKISQQNLLIISIPLTFQIIFVAILLLALGGLEKQYERESHLRMAMGGINGLLNQMLASSASEGMFQATQNKAFRKLFENGFAESRIQSAALKKLLAEDPSEDKDLGDMKRLLDQMNVTFDQGAKAMNSGEFTDMVVAFKKVRDLIEVAQVTSASTVRKMEAENQQHKLLQRQAKVVITAIIVVGALLNFSLLIALLKYIDAVNQKRFDTLSNNIHALSMQRPLMEELEGDDEVAALDSLLHQVNASLQQARRKEQAMIDNALDVICSLDLNLRFQQANNAVAKQFLIDKDELIGKSLSSLILPEDREKTLYELQTVMTSKGQTSFENRIKLSDGTTRDILWNVVFSPDEQNLFCVAHDISGRKEVERLKQEVIAVVSHDLRAPLTSLGLTLNILAEGGMGPLTEKAQNRVAKAEASVGQLINIINDLIDIEKYESGSISLDYKIYEAAELVDDAISTIEASAAARRIRIQKSNTLVKVVCDGTRIVRVLTNLLSNAVKFSPENSRINILCEAVKDGVLFSVADEGRGIPAEKQAAVFQRWKQVEKEDETKKGGSGLGLSICKALIDAHGGTIEVISEAGQGCVFRFFLPAEPPRGKRS
jgi:PAS domain S-box-containing protein